MTKTGDIMHMHKQCVPGHFSVGWVWPGNKPFLHLISPYAGGEPSYTSFEEHLCQTYMEGLKETLQKPLSPYIMECQAKSVKRLALLTDGVIKNEQELRYALGDPLTEILCEYRNLKVCVGCISSSTNGCNSRK